MNSDLVAAEDTDLGRARLLHAQGVLENNAGHPRRALQAFRRAMRRIGADAEPAETTPDTMSPERAELAARLWISAAMSESELNGLERGLAAIATAQRFLSQRPSPAVAVHLYGQLGAMNIRAGRLDDALASLDSAVELLDHTEPAETCKILMNRGSLRLYRGDLARAREDLTRSADHAHAHQLPDDECKARHNLGYAEFLAGNLALALRIMDEALTLSNEVSMGIILLDRARVLFEAGLHREADDGLTEAAGLFAAERLWQDVGEVELARAECALLDGETQAARRFAGRARDRFRRRGNDRWRREAVLVLLQADLAEGRPGLRLAGPARRLAAEFRADGLTTRARTAELLAAEALLRAGRLDEARWVAGEAGAVRPEDSVSTRLHTRLVRARLAIAAQDPAVARREIRTGLSELAAHQAQFGSLDLQTASAVHGRQLADLDLSLALAENRPVAVLAAIERGRATSNRLPPVSAPSDPVTADLLAELRGILEGLRAIESDPSAAPVVAEQRRRVAAIERQLRSRSWQAEGGGVAGRPATLAETEARLVELDSVLVCYFEVAGRLQALVLGRGRAEIVALAAEVPVHEQARRIRADFDVLAAGYLPAALVAAVHASLARSLDRLDHSLIRPLRLGDERLVIVPTGVLGVLPWTSLPSLSGRPVVVAPSASAWLSASAGSRHDAPRVVAMAGPDLNRSHDEVTAIGALWPGARVLTGGRSRRTDLAAALSTAAVVHVAAHGEHQAENPLFSSVRLADGPLFAWELDRGATAAEHVVLSACELGQSTVRVGDEALGLTSVLLHLGTRCVVSGVARVHDDVAADVMLDYHRALAGGVDSAQALASACAAGGRLAAPFVAFGTSW